MNKVFASATEALFDLQDDATLMVGGFGLCGNPENLITAVAARGTRGLTVISNNCGTDEQGLGVLLQSRQIKAMKSSYVGENKNFETQFLNGELDVELIPQGTLAERIRSGGAGIPAFFTPTGYGTVVADGKETREWNGTMCVLETALTADFALVKAWKGDSHGNLIFRKTARNFNPLMAQAARVTIAEVEELVEPGTLDPDQVHTPGIFVSRVVVGIDYVKPIEQRTTRPRA